MSTPATAAAPPGAVRARISTLDGLRGIAGLLVVLSHGWALWPTTNILGDPFLEGIFTSGNFAVSIFFVVSGYLVTRGLLGETERAGKLRGGLSVARRALRISPVIYLMLLVLVVVSTLDVTDNNPREMTRDSVFRVATFTWNWMLQNEALNARSDLGHLWYLSVDMQVFCFLLIAVALLHRHRPALLLLLLAIVAAVPFWQEHVFNTQGVFMAELRTTTRMDAMLWGAIAALLVPYLEPWRLQVQRLLVPSAVALVALLFLTTDHEFFFGVTSILLNVALVAFVLANVVGARPTRLNRVLEWRILPLLGRVSLSLYVWHYPIFFAVARHAADWGWPLRTAVALTLTAIATALSYRLVELPLQRWLGSPAFRDRPGLVVRRQPSDTTS